MIHVVTVLQGRWPTGDSTELGNVYAWSLYDQLRRHAPPDLEWSYTCLTDRPFIPGITTSLLPRGLWTWFSKLYCFSPLVFPMSSRVLFLDLDTCIVGDWSPLCRLPLDKMATLANKWASGTYPASGMMSWRTTSDTQRIWNDFEPHIGKRPPYLKNIRTDEEWLWQYTRPDNWADMTDLAPGMIASYKIDIKRTMAIRVKPMKDTSNVRVIYFHGRPRPHEVKESWVPSYNVS